MAQTYSLEEAAEKLGVSPEEFKRRIRDDWKQLRSFRDGSSLRFRANDVDELARTLGEGSEPELQLHEPSDELTLPMEISLEEPDAPTVQVSKPTKATPTPAPTKVAPPPEDEPLILFEDDAVAKEKKDEDIFLLAEDDPAPAPNKPKTDKIPKVPTKVKGDSDVRLEPANKPKPGQSDHDLILTEEIDLGVLPETTGSSRAGKPPSSMKLTGKSSDKQSKSDKKMGGAKTPPPSPRDEEDSSEFELSLDVDSSDEFELSLSDESSEDISLDDLPVSAGPRSGINLGKPADSGVSLEGKNGGPKSGGKKPDASKSGTGLGKKASPAPAAAESDDEIDFELTLDGPGASSVKPGKNGTSGAKITDDSDSEFELTLDDGSVDEISIDAETTSYTGEEEDAPKGDIFETDFEIPALDDESASEAVALDEGDTDLDQSDIAIDDDSASEVVVIDDETAPAPVKGKSKSKFHKQAPAEEEDVDVVDVDDESVSFDDMDLDEGVSASKALEGVTPGEESEEDEEAHVRTVVVGTAPWGVFPALLLLPTVVIMFIGGLMAYELTRSLWGYHQTAPPANIVVDKVSEMLDMKVKEQ